MSATDSHHTAIAPAGWVSYRLPSRYLKLAGPVDQPRLVLGLCTTRRLDQLADDPSVVGLPVDERHTNSGGFPHAGVPRKEDR
jgi:hypothetical protein